MPKAKDGLIYLSTPEEQEEFKKLFRPDPYYTPPFEALCSDPIFRIHHAWHDVLGNSGLTPFTYAGLTGIPPRKVLKFIEASPRVKTLGFCGDTFLPIVFAPWGGATRTGSFEYTFDVAVKEYLWDYPRTTSLLIPNTKDPITLEWMLKKFGGADWRKFCTRNFNPFRKAATLSVTQWNLLKEHYQGKKLALPKTRKPRLAPTP